MKRAYIVGGEGMVGSYLVDLFRQTHETWSVDLVSKDSTCYGDIRDSEMMQRHIEDFLPNVVINLAAITDLEECESSPENCFMTNTVGAINLCDICEKKSIEYVFISTAGIFDGSREFYVDYAQGNPINTYGRSKYFAERYARSYRKAWVYRAGWMMGGGIEKDKKFVGKILRQVRSGAKVIHAVDDKLGAPTYAGDFSRSIHRHVNEGLYHGLYNMVSTGSASRYDVAIEMKNILGWEDIRVEKCSSDSFSSEYYANRPRSEILVNRELNGLEKNYMRDWKIALREYLTNGI